MGRFTILSADAPPRVEALFKFKDMTLNEIKQEASLLKDKISLLIDDYYNKTGLFIDQINVSKLEVNSKCGPSYIPKSIELTVIL